MIYLPLGNLGSSHNFQNPVYEKLLSRRRLFLDSLEVGHRPCRLAVVHRSAEVISRLLGLEPIERSLAKPFEPKLAT